MNVINIDIFIHIIKSSCICCTSKPLQNGCRIYVLFKKHTLIVGVFSFIYLHISYSYVIYIWNDNCL